MRWFRGFVVALALTAGCGGPAPSSMSDPPNLIGQAIFHTSSGRVRTGGLDVASSDVERRLGLMGRERLDDDSGMVFVFDGPTTTTFWMKDTVIPLSIAFWGDDGRIVDLFEMEPCQQDPCPTYAAQASYTYALEMNAGWFDAHDVQIGDRVELTLGDE